MGQEARRFDALKAQMLANLAEMLVRQLEYRWVKALQVNRTTDFWFAPVVHDLQHYASTCNA